MRKRLVACLLSVAALAWIAPSSEAGLLRCRRCHKFSTYICVRPYNAFSPVCFGHITGVGCFPFMGGGFGGPGMQSCFNDCGPCIDGACPGGPTGHGPGPEALPNAPAPEKGGPKFVPPQPTPMTGYLNYPATMPYSYGVVQTAAYQPGYYSGYPQGYNQGYYPGYQAGYYAPYNPGSYPMTPPAAAPSYWYRGN
jgi:hypothetical protein